jgi:dihydroneopterin aldolase
MTLFLASVRNCHEAEAAYAEGADVIDLKEPNAGALGAVERATMIEAVRQVGGRVPVSATVGDLPMRPRALREAIQATAQCGVDLVKFGLFPGEGAEECLEALRSSARDTRLIVVLFADRLPEFDAVTAASRMGASGLMLDTAGKGHGSLLDHLSLEAIASMVGRAKTQGLSVGLAGSLKADQVAELLALGPDLLGFRGALCRGSARNAALDPEACRHIRTLIPRNELSPLARNNRPWHSLPMQAVC